MSVDCIIRRLVWGDGGCITCVVRPMIAAHNTVVVMVVVSRAPFEQRALIASFGGWCGVMVVASRVLFDQWVLTAERVPKLNKHFSNTLY